MPVCGKLFHQRFEHEAERLADIELVKHRGEREMTDMYTGIAK